MKRRAESKEWRRRRSWRSEILGSASTIKCVTPDRTNRPDMYRQMRESIQEQGHSGIKRTALLPCIKNSDEFASY